MEQARIDKEAKSYTGFIAQEVEAAANETGFNFSGIIKPANEKSEYRLSYAEFVVPLVKAVQEQQEIISSQQIKIDSQQEQINMLIKEIENIKLQLK